MVGGTGIGAGASEGMGYMDSRVVLGKRNSRRVGPRVGPRDGLYSNGNPAEHDEFDERTKVLDIRATYS